MRYLHLIIVLMVAGVVWGDAHRPMDHGNPMLYRDDGGELGPVRR